METPGWGIGSSWPPRAELCWAIAAVSAAGRRGDASKRGRREGREGPGMTKVNPSVALPVSGHMV